MANNCLTQSKKVSKTPNLTDHIDLNFHIYGSKFTGEAFGKGESAFDVCCKRKKSTSGSGDEIGMENAAYKTEE